VPLERARKVMSSEISVVGRSIFEDIRLLTSSLILVVEDVEDVECVVVMIEEEELAMALDSVS